MKDGWISLNPVQFKSQVMELVTIITIIYIISTFYTFIFPGLCMMVRAVSLSQFGREENAFSERKYQKWWYRSDMVNDSGAISHMTYYF